MVFFKATLPCTAPSYAADFQFQVKPLVYPNLLSSLLFRLIELYFSSADCVSYSLRLVSFPFLQYS